ncbi:MAG: response regulator [Verrucomicrobiae bacterium]|nr:response regulator [Verrucomicrobiae bacterium]
MTDGTAVPQAPCRILVVDDDAGVRESVQKVLREAGYESLAAADGAEALERLKLRKVDLLLLDLGLPAKNGWVLLGQVQHAYPRLPVIVITGQTNQQSAAYESGARLLMEKPLDAQRLLDTIQKVLAEPAEV